MLINLKEWKELQELIKEYRHLEGITRQYASIQNRFKRRYRLRIITKKGILKTYYFQTFEQAEHFQNQENIKGITFHKSQKRTA